MALAPSHDLDVALASPEEEQAIRSIREALEPELAQLVADGSDWDHTTGDIFMVRLLRGNNSNLDEAAAWFRNMMSIRAEEGFDDIHRRCEAENIQWAAAAMPHSQDVLRYVPTYFDETNLITSNGHLFYFDALGDLRPSELVQHVGVERWVEFMKFTSERRTSLLDKLSREQGRLVKIVRVIDFEGASVGPLRAYFQLVKQHLAETIKGTTMEAMHRCYLINFPRWALVLYNVAQKILPPRLVKRIRILGREFMQDQEFESDVGGDLIARVQAMRPKAASSLAFDDGAPEGTLCVIPAGQVLERMLELHPGARATWEFRVGSAAEGGASTRGLAGRILDATRGEDSTLVFSASFIPSDEGSVAREIPAESVEPTRRVCPADGEQSGAMVADRAGVLLLSWSNKESLVRAKMLASFKVAATVAAQAEAAVPDSSS